MRLRLALALSILGTLSCSGDAPTEGAALSGTFDLVTVDGASLPKLEYMYASGDTLFIEAAELRFLSRGRVSVIERTRLHSPVHGPRSPESDTVVITYRLAASDLFLDYPVSVLYGPYTDTATVQGEEIAVRTKLYGVVSGALVRDLRYSRR
jgi:hypothetical protein